MERTTSRSYISKVIGEKTTEHRHFYGFLSAFGTGLVFALASICSKRLNYMSSSQHTTHCCAGMIVYSLPIILYKRVGFIYPIKINSFLMIRAVFTAMAFNFIYLSIMYIPLADASVIGSCSPILTAVFAKVFLKEPCGVLHCICIVLTMLGVLMVSKIPLVAAARTMHYGVSYFVGVALSFSGALSFAMANIIVRSRTLIDVHFSISVLYIGMVAVSFSSLITHLMFGFMLPKCGVDRWYMVFQGVMGGSVEMLATLALQYEEASIAIMIISTTSIVINFLWQMSVEGEMPDVYTSSGAVTVVICLLIIALREKLTAFIKTICKKSSSFAVTE